MSDSKTESLPTTDELLNDPDLPDELRKELEKALKEPSFLTKFLFQTGFCLVFAGLTIGYAFALEALFPVTEANGKSGYIFFAMLLSIATLVGGGFLYVCLSSSRFRKRGIASFISSLEDAEDAVERVDNLLFKAYVEYPEDPNGLAEFLMDHRLDSPAIDRAIANARDELNKPEFSEDLCFGTDDDDDDFDTREYLTRLLAEVDRSRHRREHDVV